MTTEACDPASDDWADNFFFVTDDGYTAVVWTPDPVEADDADDQHVTYVDAGDSVSEVLRKLREFAPKIVVTDDDDDDDDTGSEIDG